MSELFDNGLKALRATRHRWKRTASVVAILAVATVVLYFFGRRTVDTLLSRSAVIPVFIVAGSWVCVVAYYPHLRLKARTWKRVANAIRVSGFLLFYIGFLLWLMAMDSESERTGLRYLYFITALSGVFGRLYLHEIGKGLTAIPAPQLKAEQRKRYLVSIGVACSMLILAQFDTLGMFRVLLGVTTMGIACYGVRLFWINSRLLWSLGHIILLLFGYNLFFNYPSQGATRVLDGLAVVFLIASALEVIRISPESDAIAPVGAVLRIPQDYS